MVHGFHRRARQPWSPPLPRARALRGAAARRRHLWVRVEPRRHAQRAHGPGNRPRRARGRAHVCRLDPLLRPAARSRLRRPVGRRLHSCRHCARCIRRRRGWAHDRREHGGAHTAERGGGAAQRALELASRRRHRAPPRARQLWRAGRSAAATRVPRVRPRQCEQLVRRRRSAARALRPRGERRRVRALRGGGDQHHCYHQYDGSGALSRRWPTALGGEGVRRQLAHRLVASWARV